MFLARRLLYVALALSAVVVLLPAPATVAACAGLLVVLAILDVILASSPRAVTVERVPTSPVRLGQPTQASTVLRNSGSRPLRGSSRDGWQPSAGAQRPVLPLDLAAQGTQQLIQPLRPSRRGDLSSEHLTLRCLGPMGLAGRQVTRRVQHTVRVLPPFRSRRHLPSKLQRLRELDGQTAVQIRGAGTEFDSLRDYVRGDDVRSIDWRATARRQNLVVRTWRPERDRRVILCLDSSRTSAARIEDEPRLDTGMEAALLLGVLAASAGDRVDFLAFDRRVVSRARSAANGDFLHVMAEAMAPVEPELVEADFSQLPQHVRSVTSQRSLVVILTSLESASLEEGLLPVLPMLSADHLVMIAAVRDPDIRRRTLGRESAGDVYRAAAAEQATLESDALKRQLSAFGVEVVDAEPHSLPPQVADAYIRLKASGRL